MKTVALVGMATTTRDFAPWDDEDIEIWTLNESPAKRFEYVKRISRHFQLHPKWNYDRDTNQNDPEHPDWLRAQKGFPIYMQEVDPDVPMSVRYPWEEVCEHFKIDPVGPDHWKEFTSTFPYMLALAHYEGFERIEVYGFEMGSETEYAYQRSSAHLFLGILRGLYLATGKPEIYIPDGSKLLGYGMERYAYDMRLSLNPMEIEIDRNRFDLEEKKAHGMIAELQGAQNTVSEQIGQINQAYENEINTIKAKKSDPKLIQKRIQQKIDERNKLIAPLQTRLRDLDSQKLDLSQRLNYIKGMKDYAVMSLDRYHSQISKLAGPDHGVQLK